MWPQKSNTSMFLEKNAKLTFRIHRKQFLHQSLRQLLEAEERKRSNDSKLSPTPIPTSLPTPIGVVNRAVSRKSSLLRSRSLSRHATLLPTNVRGEERLRRRLDILLLARRLFSEHNNGSNLLAIVTWAVLRKNYRQAQKVKCDNFPSRQPLDIAKQIQNVLPQENKRTKPA